MMPGNGNSAGNAVKYPQHPCAGCRSIGYLSHTDSIVRLCLQETFTFLLLTTEAAVALSPPPAAAKG